MRYHHFPRRLFTKWGNSITHLRNLFIGIHSDGKYVTSNNSSIGSEKLLGIYSSLKFGVDSLLDYSIYKNYLLVLICKDLLRPCAWMQSKYALKIRNILIRCVMKCTCINRFKYSTCFQLLLVIIVRGIYNLFVHWEMKYFMESFMYH